MEGENVISGLPVFSSLLPDLSKSLSLYLNDISRRYLDHVLMVDILSGKSLTSVEAFQTSYKLASVLKALGCKPGYIVGIISENRLEIPVVMLSVFHVGATFTCFNPAYTHGELCHTIDITTPFIMFTASACYEKLIKVSAEKKGRITHIINLDSNELNEMCFSYSTLLQKAIFDQYVPPDVSSDSTAMILFSSGSSGLPKGVMLKHLSLIYMLNLARYNAVEIQGDIAHRSLSIIPMFHGYGVMMVLATMVIRDTLYSLPKFDDILFLSAIPKYKITKLALVPPLMILFAKHPMVDNYDISSVQMVLCGAAPLSSNIEEQINSKFKLDRVNQSYGMTETTVACTSSHLSSKVGSCGKLLPGFMAKIVDLETGDALGPMKEGEVCIKSLFIMKGYYNNEKETKEAIDAEGWLHTGDVGYYDEDEHFFIVDRIKDLIKYKGFQVAPAELEAVLLKHEGIKEAAVIGITDEISGELPKAFVVKQPGFSITENEIVKYVSDQVAPHMRLRAGVTFIDAIPKNPAGKILRRELRNRIISKL